MTIDEIIAAAKLAEIIKDAKENPMPQTFDPALRKFVPSLSDAGAKRVVLYGPDGNPISVTDGRLEVNAKLTGSLMSASLKDISSATTIDVGKSEIIALTPPAGKIWTVQGMRLNVTAPPGATTGTHQFEASIGVASLYLLIGTSDYNKDIFYWGNWQDAAGNNLANERPKDKGAQAMIIKGLKVTANNLLRISYANNTNAAQTGKRTVLIDIVEEDIAS